MNSSTLMTGQVFQVEFLENSDIGEVNDFYNLNYGQRRKEKQWRWLFDHPVNGKLPFVIARNGRKIVGSQALIPITLLYANKEIQSAKSEETLIAPDWRGKGLLKAMYEPLFELCDQVGIQVIWGFTPAGRAFTNVGFSIPFKTSQLIYILDRKVALNSILNASSLKLNYKEKIGITLGKSLSVTKKFRFFLPSNSYRITVSEIDVLEASSIFDNFNSSWGGITIKRDFNYLNWRIKENPFLKAIILGAKDGTRLVGWIAVSMDQNSVGYIVDSVILKRNAKECVGRILIIEALRFLDQCGAGMVRAWSINNHPYDKYFKKIAQQVGFVNYKDGENFVAHQRADFKVLQLDWDDWYISRLYSQGVLG